MIWMWASACGERGNNTFARVVSSFPLPTPERLTAVSTVVDVTPGYEPRYSTWKAPLRGWMEKKKKTITKRALQAKLLHCAAERWFTPHRPLDTINTLNGAPASSVRTWLVQATSSCPSANHTSVQSTWWRGENRRKRERLTRPPSAALQALDFEQLWLLAGIY